MKRKLPKVKAVKLPKVGSAKTKAPKAKSGMPSLAEMFKGTSSKKPEPDNKPKSKSPGSSAAREKRLRDQYI